MSQVVYRKILNFTSLHLPKLPLVILSGLVGFSLVAMILLLLNQFSTLLIWTIGSFVAILFSLATIIFDKTKPEGNQKINIICDLIILIGLIFGVVFNLPYTSQRIETNRDPATYAVASSWLATHENFLMDNTSLANEVYELKTSSAGFVTSTDEPATVYAQGQHLLPALLGAIGKIVGQVDALKYNVIFGATAILAFYCFARLFTRSYWALIAAAIMATSLPLIYFARGTYTEPLAATFTFTSLALLALAMKNKKSYVLWGLAGISAGAITLARIDGYLNLIGLTIFLGLYLAFYKENLNTKAKQSFVFIATAAAACFIAWLDLKILSPIYLITTWELIRQELLVIGLMAIFGLVITYLSYKTNLFKKINKKYIKALSWVVFSFVILFSIFIATRHLWYQEPNLIQNAVKHIQITQGLTVEPRTYAELTPFWISWYVGSFIAILGALSIAVYSKKAILEKKMLLLPSLLIIVGVSLLYFIKPSITPDQLWATRRMLPVVMPGLVIFGVLLISKIFDKIKVKGFIRGIAAVIIGAILISIPWQITKPFAKIPDTRQYPLLEQACSKLPQNAVVIWLGLSRYEMVQATRTYCDIEAYNYRLSGTDKPTKESLINIHERAEAEGKTLFVGLYESQTGGLIDKKYHSSLTRAAEIDYIMIQQTLTKPPTEIEEVHQSLLLGLVNKDGSISPVF